MSKIIQNVWKMRICIESFAFSQRPVNPLKANLKDRYYICVKKKMKPIGIFWISDWLLKCDSVLLLFKNCLQCGYIWNRMQTVKHRGTGITKSITCGIYYVLPYMARYTHSIYSMSVVLLCSWRIKIGENKHVEKSCR